jgi:hypothetical protein
MFSLRDYSLPLSRIHERPKPAQTPAKRSARVVRNVPEKAAQSLTSLRPVTQHEVCQQSARFLGLRQRNRLPIPLDLELSKATNS